MPTPPRPVPGIYDAPLTTELETALTTIDQDLKELDDIEPTEAPRVLGQLLHRRLVHAFGSFSSTRKDSLERQVELANRILNLVDHHAPDAGAKERVVTPGRRLLAVRTPVVGLGAPSSPIRPHLPLASSDLIVNGHHDIALGPEVKRELASADRVDLLCSFLKWSGFRLMQDELAEVVRRRPGSLRILTTAYMSATDRRALDALRDLGAEVRVSYDTTRTRLHAKAWLFHRDSGFSTGSIGSSNLSAAAMLDGLEWNVRLSQQDNRPILEKLAELHAQLGQRDESATCWKLLANSFLDEGDLAGAEGSLRKSLALNPKDIVTWQKVLDTVRKGGDAKKLEVFGAELAERFKSLGLMEVVRDHLAEMVKAFPENLDFKLGFADARFALGDHKGCVADLLALGLEHHKKERWPEAERIFGQVLKYDSANARAKKHFDEISTGKLLRRKAARRRAVRLALHSAFLAAVCSYIGYDLHVRGELLEITRSVYAESLLEKGRYDDAAGRIKALEARYPFSYTTLREAVFLRAALEQKAAVAQSRVRSFQDPPEASAQSKLRTSHGTPEPPVRKGK